MNEQDEKTFSQKMGVHIRGTLVVGVLILVPVAITYVLIVWVFNNIDGLLQPVIMRAIDREIPGLGLIALILIVYLLGLVWTKRIGRRMIRTLQHYLVSIPVIGAVYGPARKLIESFSGDGAAGFKRVVVVEYPKQDTWMIGFLTGITNVVPGTMMGVLYLPTAPTPNSGWVAMIPIQQIYDTTMTVQEAMSMVLSGGISSPLQIDLKPMDQQEAIAFIEQGGVAPSTPQVSSDSGVFNLPFIGDKNDDKN
jgi:uncharacterized membrane protein